MAVNEATSLASPKADAWSIEEILNFARNGRLRIPVFQRSFRWEAGDVLKLFDSLYRGFPIGNLLIWETDPPPRAECAFGPLAFEPSGKETLLIIDGQQRVTSLVATLLGGGVKDRRFDVAFDLVNERFVHPAKDGQQRPHLLPLTEVADTIRFLEWLQSRGLQGALVNRANALVRALRDYKVPVYTVRGGREQEQLIREIFKRLNTTGRSLRAKEIFNAIHGGRGAEGLSSVSAALEHARFGKLDEGWLLKALAATLGLEDSTQLTDRFTEHAPRDREAALRTLEIALSGVIEFLRRDAGVPHWSLLPYRFPIIPLAAFFARYPDPDDDARRVLRVWLWRGAQTNEHGINNRPVIRAALSSVEKAGSALDAARRLDSMVGEAPSEYSLRVHNLRHASTKVVACALADLRPRHVQTREVVDLQRLLEREQPFSQVAIRSRAGAETRILHPALCRGVRRNARRLVRNLIQIASADPNVLVSHAIRPEAVALLARGEEEGFLENRRADIHRAVRLFLNRMGT